MIPKMIPQRTKIKSVSSELWWIFGEISKIFPEVSYLWIVMKKNVGSLNSLDEKKSFKTLNFVDSRAA